MSLVLPFLVGLNTLTMNRNGGLRAVIVVVDFFFGGFISLFCSSSLSILFNSSSLWHFFVFYSSLLVLASLSWVMQFLVKKSDISMSSLSGSLVPFS